MNSAVQTYEKEFIQRSCITLWIFPPLPPRTGCANKARRSEWPRPGTPAETIVLKNSNMAAKAPPCKSGLSASLSTSGSTVLWMMGIACLK